MKKHHHYSIFLGVFLLRCVSDGQIASVDKLKKKVEVQSVSDMASSMPDLNDNAKISSIVESLRENIEKDPRDIKSLVNLAQLYLLRSDYKKAESYCRQALRVDLKNVGAKKILAQVFFRRGQIEMAKIILNGLGVEGKHDSQMMNMMGMIALKEQRNADALAFFNKALKVNPSDVAVRMNLGVLYVHYRQLQKASIEFERVLKVMPDHNDAKLHLAIIKASRGNYGVAEDIYQEILDKKKENPLALYNLGVLEKRRDNYDDSVALFRRYLNTKAAKESNNKEVFTLIDEIRSDKQSDAGRVSDEEIQDMANEMGRAPQTAEGQIAKENVVEEESVQGSIDDEIQSLEDKLR